MFASLVPRGGLPLLEENIPSNGEQAWKDSAGLGSVNGANKRGFLYHLLTKILQVDQYF